MTLGALRDLRVWLLGLAFCGLIAALAQPRVTLSHPAYDLLFVLDITGSMNARDYRLEGQPASRLQFVKHTLRQLLARLPCGSRFGLAIFTERRSFLLFVPVEVCENFAPIDGALAALDWRMAWEGDSRIASGLHSAIEMAGELQADLVLLTDGQEAPPLPTTGPPAFEGEPGDVRGLIVGVGGRTPVPIPKFDDRGREIGFVAAEDVPHETRVGPPPADASSREGWHPRNAPFGAVPIVGSEHLTAVREEHLRALARQTGLGFALLTDAGALETALRREAVPRSIETAVDLRPLPAGLALAALLAVYGILPLARAFRARRHTSRLSETGKNARC